MLAHLNIQQNEPYIYLVNTVEWPTLELSAICTCYRTATQYGMNDAEARGHLKTQVTQLKTN